MELISSILMFHTALEESSQCKDPFFALELAACREKTDGRHFFILMKKLNFSSWVELFRLTTLDSFLENKQILFTYYRG